MRRSASRSEPRPTHYSPTRWFSFSPTSVPAPAEHGDLWNASMKGMNRDQVESGRAVLAEAVAMYRTALGDRLVAAYALGSLAHGGFSALVSDVDLGLLLSDPLRSSDPETVLMVAEAAKAGGSELHERLSVFWGSPLTLRGDQPGGRFPPLDVLDLIQNGLLLMGEDARLDFPEPSRVDLLVAGAEFALTFLAGVGQDSEQTSDVGSMRPADSDTVEQLRRQHLWGHG